MSNQRYICKSILWMARIWGSLLIAFILVFLIAHIFEKEPLGEGISGSKDLITFICFPVLTLIGLALAYKWEGTGGLVSTIALVFGIALNGVIDLKFILLIFPPGNLYISYWYLHRRDKLITRRMKLH